MQFLQLKELATVSHFGMVLMVSLTYNISEKINIKSGRCTKELTFNFMLENKVSMKCQKFEIIHISPVILSHMLCLPSEVDLCEG